MAYNLYLKFSGNEFQDAWITFKKEFSINRLHFLVISIALTFVNWGLETLKYYITIQKVQKLSFLKAYKGILYGNALNLILPVSIGEITGRPLVLNDENRTSGSGVAYYVSIVQKVASPFVGLLFFGIAVYFHFLDNSKIEIFDYTVDAFYFIVIISFLDLIFWLFLFLKPSVILGVLERIKSLRKIFEKIDQALNYSMLIRLKLIGIGMLRFLVFVTQYWILTFLFFSEFPYFQFYILCGVYFLAQFVIPSLGFSDLALARINISVMNVEDKQEIIENFILHKKEIRKILGDKMRHSLRKIPELEFYLDSTLDYVENINTILNNLNIPKDKENEE